MAGLGSTLAAVLALANRKLYVWEDPRIDDVESMLPASNCGACGTAGCRQFAEALIRGDLDPGACTVATTDEQQHIANFLGVDVGEHEQRVARLACAGGSHVAHIRAHYEGLPSCRAASLVSGGGKGCTWGCLGLGDCEVVCDFDAITMDAHHLPVVIDDLCTACGDCVDICPRQLFSIHPVSHQLWVACKNQEAGAAAEAECEVICDGCGRCALDAPEGLVRMEHNLAIVDYDKNALATRIAIERCPTGAIVWLDKQSGVQKGFKARKIIRQQPLPPG
ncbi:MAG: 4Fe-4S binding protein [Gammaproteobacteria bacterium]|nr:4Fe-4S binding protein [Gammaproteobacteria bacterium]